MKKILDKVASSIRKAFGKIGDAWYSLKVFIHSKTNKNKQKIITNNTSKIRNLIFYSSFITIPFVLFILTHVIINGNAILLSFQKYDDLGNVSFAAFENFSTVINDFLFDTMFSQMFIRSCLVYLISTAVGVFVPILFSYYVYKKLLGYKVFKVLLFLPTILSSIITISIFKMTANETIPAILKQAFGKEIFPLLSNPNTTFNTLLFYNIWMGLGSGLLTQLAAMNTVDPSVTESAQLEGVNFFQELWHIVLPACYQVLTLGLVTSVASIFGNTLNLYAFYGSGAPNVATTIGYYFQVKTIEAANIEYPYLSAYGLLVTAIVVPITLSLRHVINKYGPTEESNASRK